MRVKKDTDKKVEKTRKNSFWNLGIRRSMEKKSWKNAQNKKINNLITFSKNSAESAAIQIREDEDDSSNIEEKEFNVSKQCSFLSWK
jgi:hypothetical protein